jgi:hypothetical protein
MTVSAPIPIRDLRVDWSAPEADRREDYAGRVMTRNGIPVQHDVAWKLYRRLDGIVNEFTDYIRERVPGFTLTAAGTHSVVYRHLGLSPDLELPENVTLTDSGGFSTNHAALCGIVRKLDDDSSAKELLRRVILANKAQTTRDAAKSFLHPDRLTLLECAGVKVPKPNDYHVVDGFIHCRFSPKTLNGRFAASKPNNHGYNKAIKAIFGQPGWSFIQADADQIHIRIQANEWGIPRLCNVLNSGEDPHMAVMRALWGDAEVAKLPGFNGWVKKPDPGSEADACRQLGKVLNYTGAYGGGAATLLAAALKPINRLGIPVMHGAGLAQFQDLLRSRKALEPEWAEHYSRVRAEWKARGYLETSATRRRFRCKGGKVTELYNCTVLGFEADLMGAMTHGAAVKWPKYLVNQSHDSLVLHAPDEMAEELKRELELHMNVRYIANPGFTAHNTPYTAGASITPTLQEVK